jgi:hypothetical protein
MNSSGSAFGSTSDGRGARSPFLTTGVIVPSEVGVNRCQRKTARFVRPPVIPAAKTTSPAAFSFAEARSTVSVPPVGDGSPFIATFRIVPLEKTKRPASPPPVAPVTPDQNSTSALSLMPSTTGGSDVEKVPPTGVRSPAAATLKMAADAGSAVARSPRSRRTRAPAGRKASKAMRRGMGRLNFLEGERRSI